jgi:hypothetical protein
MNELQKINTLTTKLDEEINQESERASTNHHRQEKSSSKHQTCIQISPKPNFIHGMLKCNMAHDNPTIF